MEIFRHTVEQIQNNKFFKDSTEHENMLKMSRKRILNCFYQTSNAQENPTQTYEEKMKNIKRKKIQNFRNLWGKI